MDVFILGQRPSNHKNTYKTTAYGFRAEVWIQAWPIWATSLNPDDFAV
jgi:hypothetical protein